MTVTAERRESLLAEMDPIRPGLRRWALLAAGSVSVALGLVGIALPLLPTTPFLLLAAACYARSSERFYLWLMTNRLFGEYIRDWRTHRSLPTRVKVSAITMIWVALGSGIVWVVPVWPGQLCLAMIGLATSALILRMPTRQPGGERLPQPGATPTLSTSAARVSATPISRSG